MSHGLHSLDEVVAPRSKFYQGPFGRICSDLEPWSPPGKTECEVLDQLLTIAQREMVELPGRTPTEIAGNPSLRDQLEAQFSSTIPAGYTYFGQFIDHDITFDPASSLVRRNDPAGLLNHRTPRLDLDSVYGRGPDDSPYLYDQLDKGKMLIGRIDGSRLPDLPRNGQGQALIGDKRNDENSIVSQLQLACLMAHNTLVDRAKAAGAIDAFETARKGLRWLYQFIVWNDFVRRIVLDDVFEAALEQKTTPDGRKVWQLGLEDVYKWRNSPFMPVEFSVAGYRFGHSMVRNSYQTNGSHRGVGNFAPIFDNSGAPNPDDLRGFRSMIAKNVIQWDWFLQMTTSRDPFPQRARRIDTKLANALSALHLDVAGSAMNILAFRNLIRGWRFELPSGTSVAKKFGVPPIQIAPDHDALWFYILKEAETSSAGNRLGRVGSIIVAATFAGLLKGDPSCWINVEPGWTPDEDLLLRPADKQDGNRWTLAAIIRLSGLPVSAADFPT